MLIALALALNCKQNLQNPAPNTNTMCPLLQHSDHIIIIVLGLKKWTNKKFVKYKSESDMTASQLQEPIWLYKFSLISCVTEVLICVTEVYILSLIHI